MDSWLWSSCAFCGPNPLHCSVRRPGGRPGAPGSSLGGQVSTLDAKKAYRQNRGAQHRERQQQTAARQAQASPTLAAKQAARVEHKEEVLAQQEADLAEEMKPWYAPVLLLIPNPPILVTPPPPPSCQERQF